MKASNSTLGIYLAIMTPLSSLVGTCFHNFFMLPTNNISTLGIHEDI